MKSREQDEQREFSSTMKLHEVAGNSNVITIKLKLRNDEIERRHPSKRRRSSFLSSHLEAKQTTNYEI